MRSLSIMGIVIASLSFIFLIYFANPFDYYNSIRWGGFATLYLLAFGIVGVIKNKK